MVSTEKIIAIVEICVYIPVFIATLIVVFRHGFKRQLGWIYLIIFCIVRLAGAGFKIANVDNPTNTTDAEWAGILQSVGLSPLIMASMGLLKRITDQVSYHVKGAGSSFIMDTIAANSGIGKRLLGPATADSRRSRTIQLAQLPTTIALILCIVGGINEASTKVSDQSEGKTELKVGITIFLVIYVLLFSLVVITMKDVGNAPRGEKRIYFAVLAALPLLAVRLLWSVLAVFGHDADFSIQGGKPFIQLFMAIIEEFVIVLMYTVAGLTVSN